VLVTTTGPEDVFTEIRTHATGALLKPKARDTAVEMIMSESNLCNIPPDHTAFASAAVTVLAPSGDKRGEDFPQNQT
jgi:hypothetical protein